MNGEAVMPWSTKSPAARRSRDGSGRPSSASHPNEHQDHGDQGAANGDCVEDTFARLLAEELASPAS
jgi:hypothetical protein